MMTKDSSNPKVVYMSSRDCHSNLDYWSEIVIEITDTHVSVQGLYLSGSKWLAVRESNFGDCQVRLQCFPISDE